MDENIEIPLIQTTRQNKSTLFTFNKFKTNFTNYFQKNTIWTLLKISILFGLVAGIVASIYRIFFESILSLVWNGDNNRHNENMTDESDLGWFETYLLKLPSIRVYVAEPLFQYISQNFPFLGNSEDVSFIYIIVIASVFGTLTGTVQKFLGFPGDLPDTVHNIHETGIIPIKQAPSMFLCSSFSITSGCSLGPEAPLIALCASTCSWMALNIFQLEGRYLRTAVLVGMASGLTAFFGVPVGGCIFIFEVLHRTGLQFFEALMFAMSGSMVSLIVLNAILDISVEPIWIFDEIHNKISNLHMAAGLIIGIISSLIIILFIYLHRFIKQSLFFIGLQEHKTPVLSGFIGGFLIALIGIFVPHTLFWSEFETITIGDPLAKLPHIWPAGGIFGYTQLFPDGNYPIYYWFIVCFFKLIAISISVLSGFRGGFIFPLMFSGAAMGQGFYLLLGKELGIDSVIFAMCGAGAFNVAITRTPIATGVILVCLCGQVEIFMPLMVSILVAFYITMPFKFVMTQKERQDISWIDQVKIKRNENIVSDESTSHSPHIYTENPDTNFSSENYA